MMWKPEKRNGVRAAQEENYLLSLEAEKRNQKTEKALWGHPVMIWMLTIGFTVMDALVLYSILDKAMRQSEYMGIVMSAGIAFALNIIPLVAAKFVHQAIYGIKKYAGIMAFICILGFALFYAGTVYLRFAYAGDYGGNFTEDLVNKVENTDETDEVYEEEEPAGHKAFATVVLLCLGPLVTSIINFALAYHTDDEVKKLKETLEIRQIELKEAISDLEAALATMDYDMAFALDYDEKAMYAANEDIAARCNILRSIARNLLAEYLADASATSKLSSEMLQMNSVNHSQWQNDPANKEVPYGWNALDSSLKGMQDYSGASLADHGFSEASKEFMRIV